MNRLKLVGVIGSSVCVVVGSIGYGYMAEAHGANTDNARLMCGLGLLGTMVFLLCFAIGRMQEGSKS